MGRISKLCILLIASDEITLREAYEIRIKRVKRTFVLYKEGDWGLKIEYIL
jgi:hypothetical protein